MTSTAGPAGRFSLPPPPPPPGRPRLRLRTRFATGCGIEGPSGLDAALDACGSWLPAEPVSTGPVVRGMLVLRA
eukprot:1400506-Amphidinium_carterae.2